MSASTTPDPDLDPTFAAPSPLRIMAAPTDDANPSPASGDGTAHQSPPVDPKEFYGYLFEADKKPTKLLDLLLRGIAYHIVSLHEKNVPSETRRH